MLTTSSVMAKANTPSVSASSRLLGMNPAAFVDFAKSPPRSSSIRSDQSFVPNGLPGQLANLEFSGGYGRHDWAGQRFLERLDQFLPVIRCDVEAAGLLGEAFHVEDALAARPAETPELIADDVNGELGVGFERFAESAGRAAAGFLAIGQQDDDA